MAPALCVTATGNAGFLVAAQGFTCAIDALWSVPARLGGPLPVELPHLDLVLITHSHWDHFEPRAVRRALMPTTTVLGPPDVMRRLKGVQATTLWPAHGDGPEGPPIQVGPARVRSYRTTHGAQHSSFLLEVGGFRLFHDGDNEDTRTMSAQALGVIDVLMLCPWQGSGWAGFVQALSPGRWILSHLSSEEIAAHAAGRFLPELCDQIPLPERIVALNPGETLVVQKPKSAPSTRA